MRKQLCNYLFVAAMSVAAAHACQPVRSIDFVTMTFKWVVCDAPDLDQFHEVVPPFFPGLPGDGNTYCVPTSAMNWFVFLANRLPNFNILPGAGNYGPEQCNNIGPCPQYAKATTALAQLGQYMSTDTKTGTGGGGFIKGSKQWLIESGIYPLVTPSTYGNFPDGGQTGNTLAVRMSHSAVAGDLVMPVVGFYKQFKDLPIDKQVEIIASAPPTFVGWWRNGGHIMTLTGIKAAPPVNGWEYPIFSLSDPADGNTTTSQSPFKTALDQPTTVIDLVNGVMTYIEKSSRYKKTQAMYDGYLALKPIFLLSVDGPNIYYYQPLELYTGTSQSLKFSSAAGGRVLEIAVHPETGRHTYIAEGSSALYQVDPLIARTTRFADVPGAQKLVFGDSDETLFVLTRGEVIALDNGGKPKMRQTLRSSLDGIAYDFQRMHLTGISLTDQKLYSFGPDLSVAETVSIREPLCTSSYQFKYNPADHSFFGHCDGSATVAKFMWADTGFGESQFMLDGVRSAAGLTVNDLGHVFTTDGGLVKEFDEAMRPVTNSVWGRIPGAGPVDMLRSYHGYDARYDNTFMYENVLPSDAEGVTTGHAGNKK